MFKLPSFGRSSKNSSSQFLTLDIGTDYVKCLVFEFDPLETSFSIIGIGKQPLSYLSTRGGSIVDYDSVLQVTRTAVEEALSSSGSRTKDVIIGLSGEVTKGLVTTVRLTRPNFESQISEKELSVIIERIQETAYLEAAKEIVEMTGNPDLDIELTNSSISSVKIDDDYVKDPLGMAGKKMEVALFTAFSPVFHLKLLQKLAVDLKLKIITITSAMYSLSKSLSLKEAYSNMIVIDVGGETTDVGVVFGNGLVATRTLSLGGRHVTRAISESFGLPLPEAEEKKIRFSLGSLDPAESAEVKVCIKDVLDLWVSGLEVVFSDFNGIKIFPSRVVITGGGSSLRGIEDVLREESWSKNMQFRDTPVFEKVVISELVRVTDKTGKASTGDDVIPASLSEVYLEMNA